jgi:CubicO group peptidase (beta-lactamase class C family)
MSKLNSILYVSIVVLLVALVASTALLIPRSNINQDEYTQIIKDARIAIWQDISTGRASSASIAIMDNGKIVYSEAFAMANRTGSIPATTSTLYNIGSVSKTFCATAIMLLVDDGKVELDDPVTEYLPDFRMKDSRYQAITVRMLLDHTSGLPDTVWANNFGYGINPNFYQDTLSALSEANLKSTPGEMAPYTNDGFTLAEMIVAGVSGQSYADFLSDRIFTPLNLAHTSVSVGELSTGNVALCYRRDNGESLPAEAVSLVGAGGLSSTAQDLVRFADSFSSGGKHILTESSIQKMTAASPSTFASHAIQQVGFNPEFSFGLGLDVTALPFYETQGLTVIGKGGDTNDYHSMLVWEPEHRISVAVIEAGHGSQAVKIAFDILNSILQEKGLLKTDNSAAVTGSMPQYIPSEYSAFEGYYATRYRFCLIDSEKAALTQYQDDGTYANLMLYYSDGYFISPDTGSKFIFVSVDGHRCLLTPIFNGMAYIILGEQLPQLLNPQTMATDLDGAVWLRRNVAPYEALAFNPPYVLVSSTANGPQGYVFFWGYKEVKSATYAAIPSGTVRDETELRLIEKDGQTWMQAYDGIYSQASTAVPLKTGVNTVIIGSNGYNEWFQATQNTVLSIQSPARVFVYSSTGSLIYDSVLMSGDTVVPEGSFIMLAGNPGDVLTVTAK